MTPTSKAAMTFILSVLSVVSLVCLSTGYVSPEISDERVHFTQAEIRFSGTDATVSVMYETNPLVGIYVLAFGSWNIEEEVRALVASLGSVGSIKIGNGKATVLIEDISKENNGYFLHDTRGLGKEVDKLVLIYPDGREKTMLYAVKTPNTFYEDPAGGKD